MSCDIHETTIGILDEMVRLAGERLTPEEGERRLRRAAGQRGDVQVDVLWEREALTGAVHYDALVRAPGWGAVSVGFCPDRGIPWALRGSFRWSENEMLRVNEQRVTVAEAAVLFDFLWEKPFLAGRLVETAIVQEALARDPEAYEPSRGEVQAAVDRFRRRRGLLDAEATRRWMDAHGMTLQSLEALVTGFVRATKLRDRVVAGREEAYFAAHRADFDEAVIARVTLGSRERAIALGRRLRAGEVTVLDAAAEALRATRRGDLPWEQPPPLLARVRRCELSDERAAAIFGAEPGAVLDPIETDAGYEVLVVRAIHPATFDDGARQVVRERLFEAWLAERRAASTIAWHWGNEAAPQAGASEAGR